MSLDTVQLVFDLINDKQVDEALSHYSETYDFTVRNSQSRFGKPELTPILYWDREMGTRFDLQSVEETTWMPNLVTVEFIESSTFYSLIGLEKRRTLMQFLVGSDGLIASSNVLDSVDVQGVRFDVGFPQLFTWASLNRPEKVGDLPMLPAGARQPAGRRGFDGETAREWLLLAREWPEHQ